MWNRGRTVLLSVLAVAAAFLLALSVRPLKAQAAPPTVYGGTDYAEVYDYEYYVNRYADLKKAFANNEAGALQHFVTNGMKEGRQAKGSFHVQSYAARYADLQRAFGTNLPLYYQHYLEYGIREGRSGAGGAASVTPSQTPAQSSSQTQGNGVVPVIVDAGTDTTQVPKTMPSGSTVLYGTDYSSVFDAVYYADRYADLKKAFGYDAQKLLQHYIRYGYQEGRIAKAGVSRDAAAAVLGNRSQAKAKLDEVGWDLRKAFDWCVTIHHNREIVTPDLGTRAQANIGFTTGRGSCYVMAACFYEMAKELGYDAHQISGYVPRNDGTKSPHSWVEIDHADGVTRVYDISTYKNYKINTYAFTYGTKGTWRYIDYYRMN